jgi:PPM family protein phosphatase
MIEFGHLTHAGLRRELNEDTYYGDSELGLWLVADGMGGHEYGEVASSMARESIVLLKNNNNTLPLKKDLKKIADTAAISVFGVNLKNLLLQPYLGSKAVLGIDPCIRTGC